MTHTEKPIHTKIWLVNNAAKIEPLMAQMEQWSILSNMLNYIQYDRHPKNYHNLGLVQ